MDETVALALLPMRPAAVPPPPAPAVMLDGDINRFGATQARSGLDLPAGARLVCPAVRELDADGPN